MIKYPKKSYDVYTTNFLKVYLTIYNVTSLCCILGSQGNPLCFTTVKIVKTANEVKNFFREELFCLFFRLCTFLPEI